MSLINLLITLKNMKKKTYFHFLLVAFVFLTLPWFSEAATLVMTPSSGSYRVGDTFAVTILLNTQNAPIDAVDIRYLNYDSAVLEVMDDNEKATGVQIMPGTLMPATVANVVDNAQGKLVFSQLTAGGTTFSNTTDQALFTVRFRVKGNGYGNVSLNFTPGKTNDANVVSKVTDVLVSVNNELFTLGNPQEKNPATGKPTYVYVFVFSRNLMQGAEGNDVRELQKFLNSRNVNVAVSGPGSLGNETTYFGVLTKAALIKFQELYADEILVPVGLGRRGSGYFGVATRKKFNAILEGIGSVPPPDVPGSLGQIQALQAKLRALQEQLNRLQGR